MPFAIPAIVAAASAAIVAGGITFGVVGVFVATLALGFVSQALAPKPKIPNLAGFSAEARDRIQQVRQPITARRVVYGEVRVSGPLIFIAATNSNKFLHLVIALAGHEVQEIGAVQLNDDIIYDAQINGSGLVTSGKYANLVRIKKHPGTADQAADSDLVAEVSEWTTDHRLRGVAYLYLRLQYDQDKFPGALPNISAWVKGAKLRDTRAAASPAEDRWSPNPALCVRDYLARATTEGGLGVADADIDDAFTEAAANTCDEFVLTQDISHNVTGITIADDTIGLDGVGLKFQTGDRVHLTGVGSPPPGSPEISPPGGLAFDADYYVIVHQHRSNDVEPIRIKLATSYLDALAGVAIDITSDVGDSYDIVKKAEPRYTANGVVDTSRRPSDAITEMLSAMGGRAVHVGDTWRIFAAGFQTPTVAFDEGDLEGEVQVTTRISRRERFNAVKGVYVSPLNDGQPTDYPAVTNATYQTNDGGKRLFRELDLPDTARPHTAQRLAKIELERMRQEITVRAPFNLTGLQVQPGDVVQITNDRLGWASKNFEVVEWSLATRDDENAPLLGVDLTLRETAAAVFDWASGEETSVDPAPNTTLPDPFTVAPPTGLTLTSGSAALFLKADGTVVSRIKVAWTASVDAFVETYEVQFKKTAASVYEPATAPGGNLLTFIWDVEDGAQYDVRVRAVNHIGVRSAFVTDASHIVIGKTAVPANVTGFTAAQNGDVMNFRWTQVADVDLQGYEIRFGPRTSSPTYADATPLTKVTRGTAITSALVPPGDWTFFIKAADTSGNESTTADTSDALMVNTFDVILQAQQAPGWVNLGLGTGTNFIKHYSGVLVPDSQDLASVGGFDVFDKFVRNPVVTAIYEAAEQDIDFDDSARIFAEVLSVLCPGESVGVADPQHEIDHRLNAGAYDGFEPWSVGSVKFRFVKQRIVLTPANGVAKITGFNPTIDLKERTEGANSVTIGAGGTAITFARQFHQTPLVKVIVDGASALIATKTGVTTTGFTAHVFNISGAEVGGTIDWEATGA